MPLTEFSLIYRYFSALGSGAHVELSVGDDCAIVQLADGERLATSVDTLVEGAHFFPDTFPEDIGYRAVAVAVSDLAAMGARPLGMTIALTLPDSDELWLHAFSQGVAQAVAAYGIPLIGGDTTRGPRTISVSVMGALPAAGALLRSGARVGDEVYVSGTLGDAAAALHFLQGHWQPDAHSAQFLLERFNRPTARIQLGQQLLHVASAAIDISDGLVADVSHIANASGVGIELDPQALPLSSVLQRHIDRKQALTWALTGGDDYELCYCIEAGRDAPSGTRIGRVVAGEGVDPGMDLPGRPGYQHFGQDH